MFFHKSGQNPKIRYRASAGGMEFWDPTLRDIETHIRELTGDTDSFFVLTAEPPTGGAIYLQTALPVAGYDDGKGYIVGVGIEEGGEVSCYECRIPEVNEVFRLFSAYFEKQAVPDYSNWEKHVRP